MGIFPIYLDSAIVYICREILIVITIIIMTMKILIVDDNKDITNVISEILDLEKDYEIEIANDGFQAMHKMLSFKPKVVILDLAMPEMSGEEVLKKMMGINPDVKVIIATAHASDRIKEFCHKQGASAFITKPCSLENLKNTIQSVLVRGDHGKHENVFLSAVNENLGQIFQRVFGKNQHIKFENADLKKHVINFQDRLIDPTATILKGYNEKHPNLEVLDEEKGFTTEILRPILGSVVTVVPNTFIELIESFSKDNMEMRQLGGITEFFSIINATVISALGNFSNKHIETIPIRPFDISKDKVINELDLLKIEYTFELMGKNTWFTIYLWTSVLPSFKNKPESLFPKI